MRYYGIVEKEFDKRGVVSTVELTEEDTWVNELTRRDINNIIKNFDVFGIKIWEREVIEKENLKDIGNFGVDLIFQDSDRADIMEIIRKYEEGEIDDNTYIDLLFKSVFYICHWV